MITKDPYIAIMRAAALVRGVRLTADQCLALSLDIAIQDAALSCETECTCGLPGEVGTCEFCVAGDGKATCRVCGGRYKRKKNGLPRGHSGADGSYCRSPR
jgi:hypothetical protein